jgi:D-Tyr-tRNAtyr deacylase
MMKHWVAIKVRSMTSRAHLTSPVSQFTLHASLKKGNKPDFHQSASGEKARTFYQMFYDKVSELYDPQKVKNGVFAAMMDVALVNDGPVSRGRHQKLSQQHLLRELRTVCVVSSAC